MQFRVNGGRIRKVMKDLTLTIAVAWLVQGTGFSGEASFVTEEATFRLGESVMVPLSRNASDEPLSVALTVDPPDRAEVLRDVEFVDGHTTGFARIRTLSPGTAELRAGDAAMRLVVLSERPAALVNKMRPVVTSPSAGSAVWGKIAIGADIWVGAPGVDRMAPPEARLHLPDGRELPATAMFPPVDGPFWRLFFELDADELPPGTHAFAVSASSPFSDGPNAARLTGEPHEILVLPPPGDDEWLFAGECEDALDTPRSDRMGNDPPGVTMDAAASNFRAVALRRSRPVWAIQPEIPETGRYQLMVSARGTLAGSAYPSVGLVLGERVSDSGSVRLAHAGWHRVPVGTPVRLEEGLQWIGLILANEFNYRNQIVRMAEIDHYELRRVPDTAGGGGASMMMDGAMMDDGMAMTASTPNAARGGTRTARALTVAFTTIFDGQSVNGTVRVRASMHTPAFRNDNDYRAIRSDLWVNGRPITNATGRNPEFTLRPHDLKRGPNEIIVTAVSPCGNSAQTTTQTLIADSGGHPEKPLETVHDADRYDLGRGKWTGTTPQQVPEDSPLAGDGAPASTHDIVANPAVIELPGDLTGRRRLSAHLRNVPGADAGEVVVTLRQPGAHRRAMREIRVATITPGDSWEWHALAAIDFESGEKSIAIHAAGDGDSPAAVLGGISIDTPRFADASAPEIRILYPRPDATVDANGDCLVLDVFDDLAISSYELHVDGVQFPLNFPHTQETGPVVLPLPASILPPGERVIAVVARDSSGKTSRTPDLTVVAKTDDSPTLTHAYPRAIRLSRRLAYGVDPSVIAAILIDGEDAWLDGQLDTPVDSPAHAAIDALARLRYPSIASPNNVRGQVATRLLHAPDPVRARFTQFAMNHFSTWIAKTGSPALWEEYTAFRDAGVPRFSDLLLISATSPAMMVYLDQQNSLGRQLNENYAREIMELHTVGVHAGYTQDDVTNLAQLLTGWGAQREALMDGSATGFNYRFSPYLNHNESIGIFGISIPPAESPEQADDRIAQLIEMLTARPETARFVAEKLTAHILGHPPCQAATTQLTSAFITSGGDFRTLIRELAKSDAIMARDLDPKLLHPLEFAVATQRSAAIASPGHVVTITDRSGRGMFDRASPDGYPEACSEYADSNYQLQKWSFCRELEAPLAATISHGWFDEKLLANPAHRDALIDAVAHARFGAAPATATREALHQIMTQPVPDQTQRRRLFAAFFHMTPEAQFR